MKVIWQWTSWTFGPEWSELVRVVNAGPMKLYFYTAKLRAMQQQAGTRQGRRQGNRGQWRKPSKTRALRRKAG